MSKEKEWIAAAQQGDDAAFAQLVERHQGLVYNLALRMTGNPEDAADVAQETFLSAWRALPKFQGESSFSTWLYRMASNASIDFIRREKRRREAAPSIPMEAEEGRRLDLPDYRYSPETSLERSELRAAIEQGLLSLGEQHRQVLVLREIEGLSYQEISTVLNLEEGTVKSRIARARAELRKYLVANGNFLPSVSSKGHKNSQETTEKGGERHGAL